MSKPMAPNSSPSKVAKIVFRGSPPPNPVNVANASTITAKCDEDGVRISGLVHHPEECLRAGAGRPVDRDERLGREVVLLDDGRDEPGLLIGASAGASADRPFDGPSRREAGPADRGQAEEQQKDWEHDPRHERPPEPSHRSPSPMKV
jgi:hypothetical protein